MSDPDDQPWEWIWPEVTIPIPVREGLDSEMFDQADHPSSETFVREAIQNSLDAQLNPAKPVIVKFAFRKRNIGTRHAFLKQIMDHRAEADLTVPDEWEKGDVRWLTVEDFNSQGLRGSLTHRNEGDFWNYWLHFGVSNKDGSERGGRGIGRVTFLIASRLQTVIGYTRRNDEGKTTAICGMSVLKTQVGGKIRSPYAYLAEKINGDIYDLYDSPEFRDRTKEAFAFQGYDGEFASGLALAIPYPHESLSPEGILAAAIENFAPAIMAGQLRLDVDERTLDDSSIDEIADDVSECFNGEAIKSDVARYLELIRHAQGEEKSEQITLDNANKKYLESLRGKDRIRELQERLAKGEKICLNIVFPLERLNNKGQSVAPKVSLRAVLASSPTERKSIDRFFREGMSLPEVKAKNSGGIDLVTLVEKGELATYLNFCEGKAHLDLHLGQEVRDRLWQEGFRGHYEGTQAARLVKRLPDELRRLLTPDLAISDANIFEEYFSKPAKKQKDVKKETPKPPSPPEPPKPSPFNVEPLNEGLRIKANPYFDDWPVDVTITLAYADGTRNPFGSWSEHDFSLKDIHIGHKNCDLPALIEGTNRIAILNCKTDAEIEITGFDANRELDVRVEA